LVFVLEEPLSKRSSAILRGVEFFNGKMRFPTFWFDFQLLGFYLNMASMFPVQRGDIKPVIDLLD